MMETIEVKIKGKKYKLSKGMTLEEISKEFQKDFKYPILLAKVNNKLEELTKTVEDNATIEFYDLTSREGNKTHISYKNKITGIGRLFIFSLTFLYICTLYHHIYHSYHIS